MLWPRLIGPAQAAFRRQRAKLILERFPEINGGIVIDVGGSLAFWRSVESILRPSRVLIYNIAIENIILGMEHREDHVELYIYDGLKIPQPDGFADVVICNSVIEHVPLSLRANLAAEVMRVGRGFFVQTPAPEFPLELHFGLPFLHWLPRPFARRLVGISPFALLSDVDAERYFDETQLLGRSELAKHFPAAHVEVERFLGIPKSMIAIG